MTKQLIITSVAVVVLLGVYVFLTSPPPEREGSTWRLPDFEAFDRLTLQRGDLDLVIDKGATGWRIQEPLVFAANGDAMERVEGLFIDVDRRLVVDHQKEASPANLTRYGFDEEDILVVTLFDAGESAVSLTVGATEEAETGAVRTWIRPDGSDTLYRVNRDLRRALDKALADWRDSDVLVLTRDQQDALSGVYVEYGETVLRFRRNADDPSNWELTEPSDLEVDERRVREFIRRIDSLEAVGFADDLEAEAAGTATPEHTVTISLGDSEGYVLRFGSEFTHEDDDGDTEQRRYVQLDSGAIFEISARRAEAFMKRSGDFRSRDAFSVERSALVRVQTVDRDGSEMDLVRNPIPEPEEGEEIDEDAESTWRMESPREVDEVDMAEMRRMLTNLAAVEALRFDDEISASDAGFDDPRRIITITLADDSEHIVTVGANAEPIEGDDTETDVDHYVRVDDGDIFVLREFKVRNLLKSADDFAPPEEEDDEG
jgi:hypothetical protein